MDALSLPLIPELFSTIEVRRRDPGAYTAGVYASGAEIKCRVLAQVEPASPQDLLLLPEGARTQQAIRVVSQGKLETSREAGVDGDVLCWNSELWDVLHVERYEGPVMPHYEAVAVRRTRP